MLADPCADPGIFARVVQARLPETALTTVFVFFLSSTFTVLQSGFSMVYFKENYNIARFRGWGVQPIPRGGGGGGLGVQMLILETHRTFDFPGGGADPISPSGSAHVTI